MFGLFVARRLLTVVQSRSRYLNDEVPVAVRAADSIEMYLDDPIVPSALIAGQGGVMKYWYHLKEPNPKLSRMGSDFLSAPGKHSIDMFYYRRYSSV